MEYITQSFCTDPIQHISIKFAAGQVCATYHETQGNFVQFFNVFVFSYTTWRGSLSFSDTTMLILFCRWTASASRSSDKKPRSVLLCSHRITLIPLVTASRTSWWDISPAIWRKKEACRVVWKSGRFCRHYVPLGNCQELRKYLVSCQRRNTPRVAIACHWHWFCVEITHV